MGTFQTIIAILMLVYVLSVIVQAIQEIIKAVLRTKAEVMKKILTDFMGNHLPYDQIEKILTDRGLKINDLENFNREGFRHLLDGIDFPQGQLKGLVANAQATIEESKDHIAASYEAARMAFQSAYAKWNKIAVLITSFIVVIVLNANIISLYDQISVDSVAQQALVARVETIMPPDSQQGDLNEVYKKSREQIGNALEEYPILLRTSKYGDDFADPWKAVFGLLLMGALVSLGTPFWNDVLKSLAQVNNTIGKRRT